MTAEQITKRRVTMTSVRAIGRDEDGRLMTAETTMVDYVADDDRGHLAPYLAAQRASGQWDTVEVSEDFQAGPGGYHGATHLPEGFVKPTPEGQPDEYVHLQHVDAGETWKATEPRSGSGGRAAHIIAPANGLLLHAQLQLALAGVFLAVMLAVQTATRKNLLAQAYATDSVSYALYSTAPGAAAGTELTGGTPAYARIVPTWGTASNGVVATNAMTFNVASGGSVAGFGTYNSSAVYQDGGTLPTQTYASQGTYALTVTYTQT